MNPGLGEIYDPGIIPLKVKKKEAHEEIKPSVPPSTSDVQPPLPKWTALQLKHPAKSQDAIGQHNSVLNGANTESALTIEAGSCSALSSKWAKPQWSAPLPDIKLEERGKIFGFTEESTEDLPTRRGPEIKVEPDIKAEDDRPPLQSDTSNALTGSLFKKRKTPAGAAKGRRQM